VTYQVSTVRAQRVVRFIEEFLVVPEGKDVGKKVKLRDWQLEFIDKVYSTPTRRAILSMGRKNGTSAISPLPYPDRQRAGPTTKGSLLPPLFLSISFTYAASTIIPQYSLWP
jgi:hypothetical protein